MSRPTGHASAAGSDSHVSSALPARHFQLEHTRSHRLETTEGLRRRTPGVCPRSTMRTRSRRLGLSTSARIRRSRRLKCPAASRSTRSRQTAHRSRRLEGGSNPRGHRTERFSRSSRTPGASARFMSGAEVLIRCGRSPRSRAACHRAGSPGRQTPGAWCSPLVWSVTIAKRSVISNGMGCASTTRTRRSITSCRKAYSSSSPEGETCGRPSTAIPSWASAESWSCSSSRTPGRR